MSTPIPSSLRRLVAERAAHRCEYCRVFAEHAWFSFHIDHIISIKHGGASTESNLAYSCQVCNLNKGTDIFTFLESPDEPVRFFHPRKDVWKEHFEMDISGEILPRTPVGTATIKIFNLNHPDSIIERKELLRLGLWE